VASGGSLGNLDVMKLQAVPARHGVQWARQGFRTFFGHPMAFAALFAAFMLSVFALMLVPLLGPLLLGMLLPLVALGFMSATRITLAGGFPTPRVFFEPLRTDRPRVIAMLRLGMAYATASLVVLWLSDFADGGAFDALIDAVPAANTSPDVVAARLDAPGLQGGLLLRMILAGLLAVPFWHAPALIFWHGHGCAKALFSSTLACWRNRGAFLMYMLVWFGLIVAVSLAANLFSLLGQAQLFAFLLVPLLPIFATAFYASLYFTFADCFAEAEPEPRVHPA